MKVTTERLREMHRQVREVLARSGNAPQPVRRRLEEDVAILSELIERREAE